MRTPLFRLSVSVMGLAVRGSPSSLLSREVSISNVPQFTAVSLLAVTTVRKSKCTYVITSSREYYGLRNTAHLQSLCVSVFLSLLFPVLLLFLCELTLEFAMNIELRTLSWLWVSVAQFALWLTFDSGFWSFFYFCLVYCHFCLVNCVCVSQAAFELIYVAVRLRCLWGFLL